MNKTSLAVISSLTALTLMSGCGKSSSGGGGDSKETTTPSGQVEEVGAIDGSHIQGHYQAAFITLNPQVNGTIPGSANFYRKDDKLYAYIRLFAGRVKAWHQQFVYTGNRCPTMADDTNGDGFIDIQEAEAVLGQILIPMDSDIGTQAGGRRFFPLGDLSGYYHYERITSFQRFLKDLQSSDTDLTDDMVKLSPNEPFMITGKTFMVLGVDETTDFPETVGTKGRFKAFQTLPIACGVFKKVENIPGAAYSADSIGPTGEVVDGQDRPADDTVPETTSGSTSGTTTGTNRSDDGDGPVSDGESGTTGGHSGTTTGGATGSSSGGTSSGGTSSGGRTSGGSSSGGTTSGGTVGGASGSGSSSSAGATTGSSSSDTDSDGTTETEGFLNRVSGV